MVYALSGWSPSYEIVSTSVTAPVEAASWSPSAASVRVVPIMGTVTEPLAPLIASKSSTKSAAKSGGRSAGSAKGAKSGGKTKTASRKKAAPKKKS